MNKYRYVVLVFLLLTQFQFTSSAQDMHPLYKSASEKYAAKNYQGAIADCNQLLKIKPGDADVEILIAYARYELKNYTAALADANSLLKKKPDWAAEIHYFRGLVYIGLNQNQKAIDDFTFTIGQRSRHWQSYTKRGQAKYNMKNYTGSKEDCDKALAICKDCKEPAELKKEAEKSIASASNTATQSKNLPDGNKEVVKDIDGNAYKTITIGTQTWMSENLKATRLNDGNPILQVSDNKQWGIQQGPAYKTDYNSKQYGYGNYYNWYTVNTQKLCPVGWHVPSEAEWTELTNSFGGDNQAGLKIKGKSRLYSSKGSETNPFAVLPTGMLEKTGYSYASEYRGYYWSSSLCPGNRNASARVVDFFEDTFKQQCSDVELGHTVRCIKGESTQQPLAVNKAKVLVLEKKKQYDPDVFIPGSGQPFPAKWPYGLRDAAHSITGYFAGGQCGCDVVKLKADAVAVSCSVSYWNGKMKDIGKTPLKKYSGYNKITKISYVSYTNNYVIQLSEGIKIEYYPETEKFVLHVSAWNERYNENYAIEKRNSNMPGYNELQSLKDTYRDKLNE